MKKIILTFAVSALAFTGFSQLVAETFNSTRIINGHSVETLKKRYLEYRIEHRFGDMGGTSGGATSGYGFDNASDIRFAFEYGISDKLMIGLGRCKGGNGGYRSIMDGFVKYRLVQQTEKGMPISMTLVGASLISYNKALTDITQVASFPKFAHRMAYSTQLNIARKMNQRLSLALMPTWVHRNYVASNDVNDLFAIGGAISFKLSKTWALVTEYYKTMKDDDILPELKNSFAFGAEWCTNGHNFHFNISNSALFNEAQFIPFTTQNWNKGQFRLGFSITRNFKR